MAQRTVTAFKSTKNSRFADSTSGEISAQDSRDMYEDVADSFLNISDHLIDEDDMASDSASKVPTQQSVKAYVDAQVSSSIGNVDLATIIFEDFDIGAAGYMNGTAFNNGGGSGSSANASGFGEDGTEKANGVLSFSTSNSTAGGASWNSQTNDVVIGFGCAHTITFRMAFSDLSDGTDTFILRIGFLDEYTGSEQDGAFFRYTHGTNSGKWQAVTKSGGVETAEDTGVTAEPDVYHRFTVIINADGSQVDFYIDDVKTNDITTNIPSAANMCAMIQKTAGSTARLMYLDYYEKKMLRTTAR